MTAPVERDDAGIDANRRRALGVLAAACATTLGGCVSTIESTVFQENPHPPGTVVVANDDETAHDVSLVAQTVDDDSTVADRSFELDAGAERVLPELLDETGRYEVTVELATDGGRSFQFKPGGGDGRTASVRIDESGSVQWTVEAT